MWPLRAFPGDDGLFWLGWDLLPGAHGNVEDEDWEDEEEEEWDEECEEWEDEEEDWEDGEEV